MLRFLQLPARGRLLVGTDLQGNLKDFQQLVKHFRAAGPDAQLVLTGDLVHGPDEVTARAWPEHLGTPYRDESPALIDAFLEEQQLAPGRVHCLLGNHDHAHFGGPVTSKFHDDEAEVLEQALGRKGAERLRELVSTFPLVVWAPCGAVMLHAAPSAEVRSPAQLEQLILEGYEGFDIERFMKVPILGSLLWSRMATPEQSRRFLQALNGTIALYGHDVVREGYERVGDDQLCFSTSFGLYDEWKVYVSLDLAAKYPNVHALREGAEILPLYP
ncbi:MAG: uncharacterized protein H6Q89_3350 [Myxococcaceae bacterium]|nr:uncharacterized protein [Myxococcaceae bacterium]